MVETLLLLEEVGPDILVGMLLAGTDKTHIHRCKVGDSIVVYLQIQIFAFKKLLLNFNSNFQFG